MKNYIIKILATVFGAGYLPKMPGTFGSIAGAIFCIYAGNYFFIHFVITMGLIVIGTYAAGEYEKLISKKDPSCVVIDEFCGMSIALLGVGISFFSVVVGFLLFRFFDIVKPLGIRKLERYKGGVGIMLDDVVSGVICNIILRVAVLIMQS